MVPVVTDRLVTLETVQPESNGCTRESIGGRTTGSQSVTSRLCPSPPSSDLEGPGPSVCQTYSYRRVSVLHLLPWSLS